MANDNDTQGQSGLDNQTQLKLRFQIQQIRYIPWYSTYRIELTTQTSHNFWCCALYSARAVTPDEHYLEQRIPRKPIINGWGLGKQHKMRTRIKEPMEEAYQSAKSNLVISVATYSSNTHDC
ncbi:unnamed protein product [Fusarium venenatum]|uniref:Uncharacterized protein n=1 Tax=Fusarium venenatum TaxID=56646 RepID=A0A2L2TJQ5_9HYPO|nr:uncharacterized protein FVRRES_01179 [Fusarium venenatum]CEI64667.1 unnamed protein product [Fusarium venenatum]